MLGCATRDIVAQKNAFLACSQMTLAVFGMAGAPVVSCGVSKDTRITSCGLMAMLIVSRKRMTVSVPPGVSIAKSGRLTLSAVVSTLLVGNLDNESTAWCFLHAR